ncbi:putative integrase catalytic domain-containing protein [Phytophthora infestans]|uniref:Putative integrase catalytic domain-containing protein n=1 Tax=Phytophthora infestans TaxID=4787 RepID=A0A833T9Z8_PHYIN|nr:putative integrase catalytic domain-containing protein [Phytophthora infestans]KAF4129256.1 putative integrase catalytic domain-containing protein [Phytophthora infestans]
MECTTDMKIKRLRLDNGGELTGQLNKDFLNCYDIKHDKAMPYTLQQNRLAGCMNRNIEGMA